jgi:hypothetical protein
MKFIESKNIKVYPTAFRGNGEGVLFDVEAPYNTENNKTNVYRYLVDNPFASFVITEDFNLAKCLDDKDVKYHKFEFIINGYYFKILNPSRVFELNTD